jgi:hypothetical protein
MSFINQRYSKSGWNENEANEKFHVEQLYIDGKKQNIFLKLLLLKKLFFIFF